MLKAEMFDNVFLNLVESIFIASKSKNPDSFSPNLKFILTVK